MLRSSSTSAITWLTGGGLARGWGRDKAPHYSMTVYLFGPQLLSASRADGAKDGLGSVTINDRSEGNLLMWMVLRRLTSDDRTVGDSDMAKQSLNRTPSTPSPQFVGRIFSSGQFQRYLLRSVIGLVASAARVSEESGCIFPCFSSYFS